MASFLLGFIFSGNANCVLEPYDAWRFDDRFFAFKCCDKDQNNTVNLPEITSWSSMLQECIKHLGLIRIVG